MAMDMGDLLLLALSGLPSDGVGGGGGPVVEEVNFTPGEVAIMSRHVGGENRDAGHRSSVPIPESRKQPHPGQDRFEGGRFFK
jgi:hypothetical protein